MGWVGEQVTEPSVGAGLVALHVDWAHAELAGGHGDGLWVQSPSARREHFVVVVGESIEQSADRCRGVHDVVGRGGAGQGHGLARRDHDGAHRTDPAFGPVDQRRDGLAGQIRPGGKLPAVEGACPAGSQPYGTACSAISSRPSMRSRIGVSVRSWMSCHQAEESRCSLITVTAHRVVRSDARACPPRRASARSSRGGRDRVRRPTCPAVWRSAGRPRPANPSAVATSNRMSSAGPGPRSRRGCSTGGRPRRGRRSTGIQR